MANSPLNFDNSGFLVGLQQIENQTQSVHQDTQEIIRILRGELSQSQNHLHHISNNTNNTNHQLSQSNSGGGQGGSGNSSAQSTGGNPSNRNRDELGRFTANQENNSLAQSIGEAVGENMQGVVIDDKNLDPLIDSFNEVKDVLSPLTSLFGWLTGGKNKPSRYERRRDLSLIHI